MPKAKTYNPMDDIYVAKKPVYVSIKGENEEVGLRDDDCVIFDERLKKPKDGDVVLWETPRGRVVTVFSEEYEFEWEKESTIVAVAVTLIRRFKRKSKAKKTSSAAKSDPRLSDLQKQLDRLERVPENESERFKLESEIFKLENAVPEDEWPEVIGGGDDGAI